MTDFANGFFPPAAGETGADFAAAGTPAENPRAPRPNSAPATPAAFKNSLLSNAF